MQVPPSEGLGNASLAEHGGADGGRAPARVNSLESFQRHSRLHFIGQWRTKAHALLQDLYATDERCKRCLLPDNCHAPTSAPGGVHARRPATIRPWMIHVDMDAFFCSVALSKPENAAYRNRPVVIAAGRNNSDVSSCNYIAKAHGVRQSMWVGQARELCPSLVVLQYDFDRCETINTTVYRILLQECPPGIRLWLQVYSVDDTMLALFTEDITTVKAYCSRVRQRIEAETGGCTATCGVASTILVARLATAAAKPNGVRVVESAAEVDEFIRGTKVKDLHGVGRQQFAKIAKEFSLQFPAQALALGLPAEGHYSAATLKRPRSSADHPTSAPLPPTRGHESSVALPGEPTDVGQREPSAEGVAPEPQLEANDGLEDENEADDQADEEIEAADSEVMARFTCEVLRQLSLRSLLW